MATRDAGYRLSDRRRAASSGSRIPSKPHRAKVRGNIARHRFVLLHEEAMGFDYPRSGDVAAGTRCLGQRE